MLLSCLFIPLQHLRAQHFVQFSDRQWIELALDMIRKGIQEEDTTKIIMVTAPLIEIAGEKAVSRTNLASQLQEIFDLSGTRAMTLQQPIFQREDNPLKLSDFWDFDILDPQVTIKGDSAFVECELVLWGTASDGKSAGGGRKVGERFIFYSPPKVARVQSQADSEGSFRFPEPPPGKKPISRGKGWQLVGYETLLEFLENQVKAKTESDEKAQGERR
jgi:hypothetical protein